MNWHRTLLALGLEDLDLSGVVGPKRQLTEAIARWAYGHGYASLVYSSRFDAALTCWAIFEGAVFEPVGPPDPTLLSAVPDLTVNRSTPEGESAADTRRPPGSIRSCLRKSRLAHEALLLCLAEEGIVSFSRKGGDEVWVSGTHAGIPLGRDEVFPHRLVEHRRAFTLRVRHAGTYIRRPSNATTP